MNKIVYILTEYLRILEAGDHISTLILVPCKILRCKFSKAYKNRVSMKMNLLRIQSWQACL
jgi:hypothetical protein